MTALTQDKKTEYKDGLLESLPVAATEKIYAGALLALNATGYLLPGADTAALIFAGVATEAQDNTSGADGALNALVRRKGVFRMKGSGFSQANVGNKVFLLDDQTVALAAGATNDIWCGNIVAVMSATEVWVDIEPAVEQGRGT